jgi:hypothetical protein
MLCFSYDPTVFAGRLFFTVAHVWQFGETSIFALLKMTENDARKLLENHPIRWISNIAIPSSYITLF